MREIGDFEAKKEFSELLDLVEPGEEILITRNGRAVARLVSVRGRLDHNVARVAAAGIREMSQGVRLGDAETKRLIDEGRR